MPSCQRIFTSVVKEGTVEFLPGGNRTGHTPPGRERKDLTEFSPAEFSPAEFSPAEFSPAGQKKMGIEPRAAR